MNPWRNNVLELLQSILRFAIWIAFVAIGLMFLLFAVVFVYQFLTHLHAFLQRTIFSGSW